MDAVAMAFSKMGTPIDRAYSRPALDNANEKPGLTAAFTAAEEKRYLRIEINVKVNGNVTLEHDDDNECAHFVENPNQHPRMRADCPREAAQRQLTQGKNQNHP